MCVACVDVCSNLVALGALHDQASATIAAWFFEHIICEHGKPRYVRSDRGGEFCGAFDSLLRSLAITYVTTVPYYSPVEWAGGGYESGGQECFASFDV